MTKSRSGRPLYAASHQIPPLPGASILSGLNMYTALSLVTSFSFLPVPLDELLSFLSPGLVLMTCWKTTKAQLFRSHHPNELSMLQPGVTVGLYGLVLHTT